MPNKFPFFLLHSQKINAAVDGKFTSQSEQAGVASDLIQPDLLNDS